MFDEKSTINNGAIELLASLCNKAIAEHGDDLVAIERYVTCHIDSLPEHDRECFMAHIDIILKTALSSHTASAGH